MERLPALAPLIAAIRDNAHPPHMNIQRDVIQKVGSIMAEMIPIALQRIGPYHRLFGFQILEDSLGAQSIPKQLFDIFVVDGALALSPDRAGGRNGTL